MNKRAFRRVAVFASTAALAGGAVAGCGSDASTTSNGRPDPAIRPAATGRRDGFHRALADELGVTTAKLQAAMEKNRPQQGQQPGAGTDMAASLAKELGLSESKVKAALAKLMPQGGPPAGGGEDRRRLGHAGGRHRLVAR